MSEFVCALLCSLFSSVLCSAQRECRDCLRRRVDGSSSGRQQQQQQQQRAQSLLLAVAAGGFVCRSVGAPTTAGLAIAIANAAFAASRRIQHKRRLRQSTHSCHSRCTLVTAALLRQCSRAVPANGCTGAACVVCTERRAHSAQWCAVRSEQRYLRAAIEFANASARRAHYALVSVRRCAAALAAATLRVAQAELAADPSIVQRVAVLLRRKTAFLGYRHNDLQVAIRKFQLKQTASSNSRSVHNLVSTASGNFHAR